MKTRCMDTHEVMEWDSCLRCALGPHNCDWNYALLKTVADDQHRIRTGIHVSDIKGCLKRAYYDHTTEPDPTYPSEHLTVVEGSIQHAAMAGSGDDLNIVAEQRIAWTYEGVMVEGMFDAYYPAQKRLSDTKTTRWLTPSKLPYGDHKEQVLIYTNIMHHMGYDVKSAEIQYVDLSSVSKCKRCNQQLLPFSDNELQCPKCRNLFDKRQYHLGAVRFEVDIGDADNIDAWIGERALTLDLAINHGAPEPDGEPSILCNYCPFQKICPDTWGG